MPKSQSAYQRIVGRQVAWARRHGVSLVGSKPGRGAPLYAARLEENLRAPLRSDVERAFREADGNELASDDGPAKMQAVHSSSALVVNVFQYWLECGDIEEIAALCGLCRRTGSGLFDLTFEGKYPILGSNEVPPNIDVVIRVTGRRGPSAYAIESKFTEPFSAFGHGGVKEKYLDANHDLWGGLPHLRALASLISPDDELFSFLHVGQLIKHILGLNKALGARGFRLLYLWYDPGDPESTAHQAEIDAFANVTRADGIWFRSLTYQQLVRRMRKRLGPEHRDYLAYLTERYLRADTVGTPGSGSHALRMTSSNRAC